MSHYFDKTGRMTAFVRKLAPFAATVLILAIFAFSVSSFSRTAAEEQKHNLETALRKGIMQCYALEGRYPESLSYLLENYPIYYDPDAFYIDYQVVGQNLSPAVSVIAKR